MRIGTEEEYNLPEASLEEAAATIAEIREEALVHRHFVSAKIAGSQMDGKQCGGTGRCKFRFIGGEWVFDATIISAPLIEVKQEAEPREPREPNKPGEKRGRGRVARWKQSVEPEDETNVLEAYSCMTVAEVHEHTGISLEALSRFLKEKNVLRQRRQSAPHPEKRGQVIRLLNIAA